MKKARSRGLNKIALAISELGEVKIDSIGTLCLLASGAPIDST